METVMLAFSKQILKNVSFEKRLFWKEYRKVSRRMNRLESNHFRVDQEIVLTKKSRKSWKLVC